MRSDLEPLCRRVMRDDLAGRWLVDSEPANGLSADSAQFAWLGQSAYDNGKSLVLEFLSLAYEGANTAPQRQAFVTAAAAVHAATEKTIRPDPDLLADQICRAAASPQEPRNVRPLTDVASDLADAWAQQTEVPATAWQELANALNTCSAELIAISNQVIELQPYLTYFGWPDANRPAADAAIAQKLFDLAVAEQALLPIGAGPSQRVELVQLSADQPSLLAPKFNAASDKLTGLQFHHFGAFYKRSWRANDWMWGRQDGAGRLVQMLLDPRRLRLKTGALPTTPKRADWLLGQLAALDPVSLPDGPAAPPVSGRVPTRETLLEELAFLDDPTAPLPTGLPLTAAWAATAWQAVINSLELPKLADEIIGAPGGEVDWSPPETMTWAKLVREPGADLVEQLKQCTVPDETFQTDMGSRLMGARSLTLLRQLRVRSQPSANCPSRSARDDAVRTVAVGGYRIANAVGGAANGLIIAGLVALAVGIALAIQSSPSLGVTGTVLAAIGGYVAAIAVWQKSRMLLDRPHRHHCSARDRCCLYSVGA